jgi:hypothetical protein
MVRTLDAGRQLGGVLAAVREEDELSVSALRNTAHERVGQQLHDALEAGA